MKNILLAAATLLSFSMTIHAQEIISLYPNGPSEVSGLEGDESNDNLFFITGVSRARMVAYIAPKQRASGAAVLICPGGGYGGLAVQHEGSEVAEWLNTLGISAFVLYYRMPNHHYEIPLTDAQTAISIIRKNAKKWNIDKHKVGIAGFSAGGHLASTAATQYNRKTRPDFLILVYPVIMMTNDGTTLNLLGENPSEKLVNRFSNQKHVTSGTPPTFITVALDDDVVPALQSQMFYQALLAKNVPVDFRTFNYGGHGFGMRKSGKESDKWIDYLGEWLKMNNLTY